ncbi:hypothetical protein AVEN_253754-1 [Araneus ventricosus]|uniref:Uncharacterized protein n=1 Tax=Araneus ventricosus TaxID=182803 RepID=A0A4Y2AKH0_ARAVE|nr:hypothetical protein AVEN_253754-1 [Araneus ventricosus]
MLWWHFTPFSTHPSKWVSQTLHPKPAEPCSRSFKSSTAPSPHLLSFFLGLPVFSFMCSSPNGIIVWTKIQLSMVFSQTPQMTKDTELAPSSQTSTPARDIEILIHLACKQAHMHARSSESGFKPEPYDPSRDTRPLPSFWSTRESAMTGCRGLLAS